MMKKLFALIAVLTLIAGGISAQNVKVSGTVSDSFGPVTGAAVMVHGTTNGTVTDLDGSYSLSVPADAVLEVSCIGYKTVAEAVGGRTVVDFVLTEDSEILADAVVLGYGATARKRDLSASVGIVADPEKLATHPVTSTEAMLQGQVPGVQIASDGGDPTSTPKMVIRGQGSQNAESVLWVVDGVPGAPINSLSDIESIVVLKDAASAAIYGAQSGAGGVVLVTTKKGSSGVNVNYDGLIGVRQAAKLITPLNAEQQLEITKLAYQNAGLDLPQGWDVTKNPYIATTRTNWMDEVFRNALYHRHNVTFNAGTDTFKNRISLAFEDNQGVLVGTFKKRVGISYKGDIQVNSWLRFTEDLSWSTGTQRGADTNAATTGAIVNAFQMPSSADKYYYTGVGYGGTTTEDPAYIARYGDNFSGIHGIVRNPLRSLTSDNIYDGNSKLFTTTGLELANIVKGLRFTSKFTYYTNQQLYKKFTYTRPECGDPSSTNQLEYSTYKDWGWKTENTLMYDRTFGKHNVGALFSTTADQYNYKGFNVSRKYFDDESVNLQYLAYSNSVPDVGDGYDTDANVALIGRLSYSYDDRYFVTASWRRDYAGRLPEGHNYGDFPAVTGAWKISSEPFFPKNDAVTFLKLRASWGRIGNLGSIGRTYKSNVLNKDTEGKAAIYGTENPGGQYGAIIYSGKALNRNLTWETSEQFDLGLDTGFLNDRLNFSVDFYNKRTYNLIQTQKMNWPDAIGVDNMLINLGEIRNRGIELSLGWADKAGDFSYYINANAAYNKNTVMSVGVTDANGNSAVWENWWQYRDVKFYNRTIEGGPLNQIYIIKCLGIFQSDEEAANYVDKNGNRIQPDAVAGDLKFEDCNGDGRITADDRQLFGNSTPDWTYALNLGFSWKKLSFSAMLQGVLGAQALQCGKMAYASMSSKVHNRTTDIYDSWTFNKNSNIPRISALDLNNNFMTGSSWYLEDASYLRLKNLSVSYDLTDAIRKINHFNERNSSCLVYFSGENLLTFTKYSGLDPECGQSDFLKYPVSRVFSLGVKITY